MLTSIKPITCNKNTPYLFDIKLSYDKQFFDRTTRTLIKKQTFRRKIIYFENVVLDF